MNRSTYKSYLKDPFVDNGRLGIPRQTRHNLKKRRHAVADDGFYFQATDPLRTDGDKCDEVEINSDADENSSDSHTGEFSEESAETEIPIEVEEDEALTSNLTICKKLLEDDTLQCTSCSQRQTPDTLEDTCFLTFDIKQSLEEILKLNEVAIDLSNNLATRTRRFDSHMQHRWYPMLHVVQVRHLAFTIVN
ncbi:unnamed protein product [Allacma fusca]|uniref:Uncharacterized protein n=1 Tax=Allacma fusca TaxID=39272 RepID=A0A8J2JDL0_9HEXA|nr:unnamed protein product [Allacma fusca]